MAAPEIHQVIGTSVPDQRVDVIALVEQDLASIPPSYISNMSSKMFPFYIVNTALE